jgi:hypothetical protein
MDEPVTGDERGAGFPASLLGKCPICNGPEGDGFGGTCENCKPTLERTKESRSDPLPESEGEHTKADPENLTETVRERFGRHIYNLQTEVDKLEEDLQLTRRTYANDLFNHEARLRVAESRMEGLLVWFGLILSIAIIRAVARRVRGMNDEA